MSSLGHFCDLNFKITAIFGKYRVPNACMENLHWRITWDLLSRSTDKDASRQSVQLEIFKIFESKHRSCKIGRCCWSTRTLREGTLLFRDLHHIACDLQARIRWKLMIRTSSIKLTRIGFKWQACLMSMFDERRASPANSHHKKRLPF